MTRIEPVVVDSCREQRAAVRKDLREAENTSSNGMLIILFDPIGGTGMILGITGNQYARTSSGPGWMLRINSVHDWGLGFSIEDWSVDRLDVELLEHLASTLDDRARAPCYILAGTDSRRWRVLRTGSGGGKAWDL